MKLVLQMREHGKAAGAPQVFRASRVVVGRRPECDLAILQHENRDAVSHRHLQFELNPQSLQLRDLGSTNGSFVNERPVTEQQLSVGDVVGLGRRGPRIEIVDLQLPLPTPAAEPARVAVPRLPSESDSRLSRERADDVVRGWRELHGVRALAETPPRPDVTRRAALLAGLAGGGAVAAATLLGGWMMRGASTGDRIFARLLRSTVLLVDPETIEPVGSGVVIDARRKLVATCMHVQGYTEDLYAYSPLFERGSLVTRRAEYVDSDDYHHRADVCEQVLTTDAIRDLSILQMETLWDDAMTLPLATQPVVAGQPVHVLSNSLRDEPLWTFDSGRVTEADRTRWVCRAPRLHPRPLPLDLRVVRTDDSLNAAGSGGPLVNDRGQLVGLSHVYGPDDSSSVFVDAVEIRRVLNRLRG